MESFVEWLNDTETYCAVGLAEADIVIIIGKSCSTTKVVGGVSLENRCGTHYVIEVK